MPRARRGLRALQSRASLFNLKWERIMKNVKCKIKNVKLRGKDLFYFAFCNLNFQFCIEV
jgi:hypothetical protein